ncbi:ABC-F family ATP-binding cassette domain-containing protein [Lachnoclostridium phytofermentans]|uniref:ABC transporter related n=1 Tax=Lachnoclostridium phytofermentans (strain ATCC 700394 / DSM 18823 / ISDg) TaxID=357809 RepID=A9KM00_LACP7|nr:ABC-F family ATP-binding cassette domain-containing protein [Lachnoclostridium phytofermentans]ABX41343.1 ABC transporter related [Lachnoclostridium phytofermentans ISDg]
MVYQMKNAIIGYPGNRLLDGVSMEIKNTEKIAIVGRNGCGKTTLLQVIAGKLEVDNLDSDEEFFIQADGAPSIGYLEQISFEKESITVREELLKVYEEIFTLRDKMSELTGLMKVDSSEKLLEQYAKVSDKFESLGGYSYQYEIEQIFTKFGFELPDFDREIQTFSGGQKTRIALVKLLLSKPDIMLLDEPTNHLDMPMIEWLEGYLKKYNHAVVIVSHDRMFLDRIVDVTYEIEHKKMKRYPGNYTEFLKRKRLDYEKLCKDYEAQQKEIERLTIFIEKWKNTPTKVSMTRSKQMQIAHMVKIPKPLRFDTKAMHAKLQPNIESGKEVLTVKELKIGYEEVLASVSLNLRKGQKLAVIGENGKGKSTLLKSVVGQIDTLGGTFKFGRDVDWVYFDQELLNLDESKNVIDEFWDAYPKLTQTEVRTILGNFLFTGDDVFQPLSQLSGGEKVRLSLAKLMKRQANLMILDEPTNHLDMIGKEMLESMLKSYQGTLLFVSHDRYFVRSVADNLLIFENGEVNYYPYGYEEYLEKKEKNLISDTSNLRDENKDKLSESTTCLQNTMTSEQISYLNGKEKAKRERRLVQLENEISDSEEKINKLKLKFSDPEIATDYQKLSELQEIINKEEQILNDLLIEWAGLV